MRDIQNNDIMTPAKKRTTRKIVHVCQKEEYLDRVNLILFGNGTPEQGLIFIVKQYLVEHPKLVKAVEEINGKVDAAIENSRVAISAVDKYKATMDGVEIGEGKREAKKKLKFDTWVSIIGTIVIVVGLAITIWQVTKGNEQSAANSTKIDDLGTPVIVNARGELAPLPTGDSIKYFGPKGYGNFKDTTK
jgi:hypothetical protein